MNSHVRPPEIGSEHEQKVWLPPPDGSYRAKGRQQRQGEPN
ncbi:MAG: hypothetical protein ACREIA_15735 [Opitutaceae bacterium]